MNKGSVSVAALAMIVGATVALGDLAAVEIIAHRGASFDAPENTMAATRLAWIQEADGVETDVMFTRDGRLVVFHDRDSAKRTTGRALVIGQLTQAEARALDAGSWRGLRYFGEKIPLLEEQIASMPPGRRLFVEIKGGAEVIEELQRVITAAEVTPDQVTLISFDLGALRAVRERLREFPSLYLAAFDPEETEGRLPVDARLDRVIADARGAGATGLDLQSTWPLTAEHVRKIRAAELELHVWTVNDPAVARDWIALGVDSITTDRPGWLRARLAR